MMYQHTEIKVMMKDGRGGEGGGGSLFITGPPATFLVYRPIAASGPGDRAAPNLLSDKRTVLLGPLKLAELELQLGTLHLASRKSSTIRRTGTGREKREQQTKQQLTN
jgi:hypothetical protein